jgi:protein-disulfide isomerase
MDIRRYLNTKVFLTVSLLILSGLLLAGCSNETENLPSEEVLVREDSWFKGSQEAKVVIVEFSDFECPACATVEGTVSQLISQYGERIKFVYRHFPLKQHQYAFKAAEAAEAAGEQGKFWEMKSLIFANQTNLNEAVFENLAQELGLDLAKFRDSLNSGKFKDKINRDYEDGDKAGVRATPTFFINGKKYEGGRPFEAFKREIDSLLSKESAS